MGTKLTRRQILTGAGLAGIGWAARGETALADVAINPNGAVAGKREPAQDVLIHVFMRGGADGLNIIVPYAEDAYHRHRPNLRIPGPNDKHAAAASRALDLDGFFGMNPALAPLLPAYREGQLAIIHAIGSNDQSRSHFEAMSAMERGLASEETGTGSGWLARHLSTTQTGISSPLRAIAFSNTMPDLLRGATDATALNTLADFRLYVPGDGPNSTALGGSEAELRHTLAAFYSDGKDAVSHAGRETLAVLETLNRLDPTHYRPSNGAKYPEGEFGNGLRQVACLLRGKVGLEVACLDHRGPLFGWDTHVSQGTNFAAQVGDLASGLAAFTKDMGAEMNRVTVVVMTEFGRRLQENSGLGTDHGRAGVAFALGNNIAGGKVYHNWPGMEDKQLESPGDLRVTTDYRDLLAEVVQKRLHNDHLSDVFPDYTPKFVGVTKA